MRKRISRHADECEVCDNRRRGTLRTAALFGMAPLAVLPHWLREDVLQLCSDASQPTLAYRREVALRAGPFGPNGFPQAIRPPRQRALALARIAATVGIVIAVVSAGIVTVLALRGSRPPHSADAVAPPRGSVTGSALATAEPTGSAEAPASAFPTVSQPTTTGQGPAAGAAPVTPAKPSPSHSMTALRIGLTHADTHTYADAHAHPHGHGDAHSDVTGDAHGLTHAQRDNTGAIMTVTSGQERVSLRVARDGVVTLFRLSGYSLRLS